MSQGQMVGALITIFIMVIGLFVFANMGGSEGIEDWIKGRRKK